MTDEHESIYIVLGKNIRKCRLRAGVTQKQLADMTHFTRTSVCNIEAGRQRIALHILFDFAQILHVSPADLLSLDQPNSLDLIDIMAKNMALRQENINLRNRLAKIAGIATTSQDSEVAG
jgi:transcriptional regulator with XRE-family HTH domain